jgi:DNA polymerase-3 subunit epsilon
LIEGARIQLTANPSHRITPEGSPENQELGRIAHAIAERFEELKREVEGRIQEANAHLEEERNRLAALMSELTQSVLVCNAEGRILLLQPNSCCRAADSSGNTRRQRRWASPFSSA